MGKRAHGRLVHEVRAALYKAGFMPTRITQLDTPKGLRAARSPGFKVEKHNDGKSVRLFHVTAGAPAELTVRHSKLLIGHPQARLLEDYKTKLEQQGFTSVGFDVRDRLASYSLWRRVAEVRPASAPNPRNDGRR
jgi:hypothetical protein